MALQTIKTPVLRFGTRGSALALAQTGAVEQIFRLRHPEVETATAVIQTEGDVDKTSPLTLIGGRGVFTSALQGALTGGTIDAAVHSAKDLPSERPNGLQLSAFLIREDPRDVLVSRHGCPLAELPPSPLIGTSSRRRAAQVLAQRPDARIVDLRGNVDTRLRKALEPDIDGIVLAAAGVTRMGWDHVITEYLPLERLIPSPGQGALAVETRIQDEGPGRLIADLDDPAVSVPVRVERAFLRGVGGGCTTPIGAHAEVIGDRVRLRCMLGAEDGRHAEWDDVDLPVADAEDLAMDLARRMLASVHRSGHVVPATKPQFRAPLAGLTVLVTRAPEQAGDLSSALLAAGAEPVEAPTIRIDPPLDWASLDEALQRLWRGEYDWIVFTSANAVRQIRQRSQQLGYDSALFDHTGVAAVGTTTAGELEAYGVSVDVVPEKFTAEAVLEALTDLGVAGQRILLPQGNLARKTLAEGLRAAGALVDSVETYRTSPVAISPPVRDRMLRGAIDVATFASPSSVRNLVDALGHASSVLQRIVVACVGPMTAETARRHGIEPDVVAEESTVDGLVDALIQHQAAVAAGKTATGPGIDVLVPQQATRGGGRCSDHMRRKR